jgi:hypothetical protein
MITDDQEATRRLYEDVIGMPLVATWTERDVLEGLGVAAAGIAGAFHWPRRAGRRRQWYRALRNGDRWQTPAQ